MPIEVDMTAIRTKVHDSLYVDQINVVAYFRQMYVKAINLYGVFVLFCFLNEVN